MTLSPPSEAPSPKPAVLHRLAADELQTVAVWLEQQPAGLGEEFLNRVAAVFVEIEENPETGVSLSDGLRAKRVRRFPYHVYFRVHPTLIHLLAVRHSRQRPLNMLLRDRDVPQS